MIRDISEPESTGAGLKAFPLRLQNDCSKSNYTNESMVLHFTANEKKNEKEES